MHTWHPLWWPGAVDAYPGILSAQEIAQDMRSMFEPLHVQDFDWLKLAHDLSSCHTALLQVYWADATSRGLDPLQQGPQWAMQQQNAALCASLGTQRRTGMSPKGLAPLLPAGMGKIPHMHNATPSGHRPLR